MNKQKLYDLAFSRWGYDAQIIALGEESAELAAAACKFVNHKNNGKNLAEECADVEIMIEQVRHNGLHSQIDVEKDRKLARLALLLEGCGDIDMQPSMADLLASLNDIEGDYIGDHDSLYDALIEHDYHAVSCIARRAAGRLMHLAQKAGRIAQLSSIPSPSRSESEEK